MNHPFNARWGRSLIIISSLATVTCLGVAAFGWSKGHHDFLRFWLPLLLPIAALPFMVRGYRMVPGALKVRRLFWETNIPLVGLASAERDPEAMKGCLRIFGNGGVFSFTGWFWNRRYGFFRVIATNTQNMVALKIGGKTIIVSPDRPLDFIAVVSGKETSTHA